MNRNPSDSRPPPRDNENGYEQRSARPYPHPAIPQQLRPGPPREGGARQPAQQISQMDQRRPDQYQGQQPLQRQPSRPDQQYPAEQLQRQLSRPDLSYQPQPSPGRQPLQRQPSRPDIQQPPLQRQPSRPDQQQQSPQLRQPQPSRPDLYNPDQALSQPMAEQQYKYQEVPLQPVAPVLMRNPSAPGTVYSGSSSDSQSTLTAPIRPYASDAMLIRNNSDDELDKSDAFWRRFNASAAVPDAEKSSWLEKTEGKRSVHSRVLWIVGIIFLILAAGGIAIGVFISFHDSSNTTRPTTIGGAADITGSAAVVTTGAGAVGGTAASSSLHVSPTNTVNDR